MTAPYSFSKINTYRTCAWQYRAKYITKEVKFTQSPQALWGVEVHECAEHYINDGKLLTPRFDVLRPYLTALDQIEGIKRAEVELAIKEDLTPCGFWDADAMLRGKIDVLVDQGDKAIILDWKTGRAKPQDRDELRCFSVLTFLNKPEIEKTKNTYIWLKKDAPPTIEYWTRDKVSELLEQLQETIQRIEHDTCYDSFKPRKNGLCQSYCDAPCKFNARFPLKQT